MPKINHRRKNRTDGDRSGGFTGHWNSSFHAWWQKRYAWHCFRQYSRQIMYEERYEMLPPAHKRVGYWSGPGFAAPNIPRRSHQ
jgi:hypothetical protein